ncbi:MAG TPA: hypothetical protein VN764_13940, partial [Polyangiaceae bacterium]|nr:hypothetical protein [Polyangiaceae bacterium]
NQKHGQRNQQKGDDGNGVGNQPFAIEALQLLKEGHQHAHINPLGHCQPVTTMCAGASSADNI